MSNEITTGKRVLFRVAEDDATLTPGIVEEIDSGGEWGYLGAIASVLANGITYKRRLDTLKLGTQDTDPAAWMLHDGKTTTPVVHRDGCYICSDSEFARMGLPLCRPCPDCKRNGRGLGHIAADDGRCDDCGYEDGPDDYPEMKPPPPVPPYTVKTDASRTQPGESYVVSPATVVKIPDQEWRDGEGAVITVPEDCTVQGVQIFDSSEPPRPVYYLHIGTRVAVGDSVHVPGTIEIT